jgi:hypothetical protein
MFRRIFVFIKMSFLSCFCRFLKASLEKRVAWIYTRRAGRVGLEDSTGGCAVRVSLVKTKLICSGVVHQPPDGFRSVA